MSIAPVSSTSATERAPNPRLQPVPRGLWMGVGVLGVVVLGAVLAGTLSAHEPQRIVGRVFESPSADNWLGTDESGRDVWSRMLHGARTSLIVGLAAAVFSLFIGGLVGITAGYLGGAADRVLSFLTNFFLTLPVLPLMIVIAAFFGSSEFALVLIIGMLSWMVAARLIRSEVTSLRSRPYVLRAKALGSSPARIMLTHLLPQVSPILAATTVIVVGNAIFFEAALAFLGLADPQRASWGNIIATGFDGGAVFARAWWVVVPPGVAITATVLCCTAIGRGLEQRWNPKLSMSLLSRHSFRYLGPDGAKP